MQDCLVKNEAILNLREIKLGKRNVNRQKIRVVIYSIGQCIASEVVGQCLVLFVSLSLRLNNLSETSLFLFFSYINVL